MEYITNYLVEILFSFVSFLFAFLYKRVKKMIETVKSSRETLLVLTKDLFIQRYYCYKKENSIGIYEKEALIDLYNEYKKLGGNGFVEDMFEEIEKIPVNRSL